MCLQTCFEQMHASVPKLSVNNRDSTRVRALLLLMTAGQVKPGGFHSKIQNQNRVQPSATTLKCRVSPIFIYKKHSENLVPSASAASVCWLLTRRAK